MTLVNNSFYDTLGDRWYEAQDDPVALLRAESASRTPWVANEIRARFGGRRVRVLDVGCGAGFLSNALARYGHDVTGVDASAGSLAVAARHDETHAVHYVVGDALRLPFGNRSFEAVSAMDLLEHIEDPAAAVAEAARVLAKGGLFFFHTFNRSPLAWLMVIKGVEWFVKNTPRDMHVLRLFVKPQEMRTMCEDNGLLVREIRGLAPRVLSRAFVQLLLTREVPDGFAFRFTRSTQLGFTGVAQKT